MLVAEPAELTGEADTPLAAHIGECERCRAAAARVIEAGGGLRLGLEELRPRTDVVDALARARARASVWPLRIRARRLAVTLAAAAALASLWIMSDRAPDPFEPGSAAVVRREPERPPIVQAPPDKSVVVLATDNPRVKIIWLIGDTNG